MARNLTASDRSALIKLASTMPKGSDDRKVILAGLKEAKSPVSAKEHLEALDNAEADLKKQIKKVESKIKALSDIAESIGPKAIDIWLRSDKTYLADRKAILREIQQERKDAENGKTPDWVTKAAAKAPKMVVKDGYVKSLRHPDSGKVVKEVKVNGKRYVFNSTHKTFNSKPGNDLLTEADVPKISWGKSAAKAPKKLKGKKLEHLISRAYSRLGDRVQVNMMDLGKIYSAAEKAYAAAEVEEAEAEMEKALEAALTKYRMN